MATDVVRIGVLALQGDFDRHAKALARCGVEAVEVRKPEQLADVEGLIIPGGESTTLLKLMHEWGFVGALQQFHAEAAALRHLRRLILLARDVENPRQFSLGLIDVGVERNAYGRQRESFEAQGSATLDGRAAPVEMVFIRAPRIRRVGAGVETLARHGDEPVMARQGSVLVATFHPELTDDSTVHQYFCSMVVRAAAAGEASL